MPLRRFAARSSRPPARAESLAARGHTAGLLDKLRASYPRDEWALFTDVRNAKGIRDEVRYADAISVRLVGAPQVHGF
jgi:hypothetical protein